MGDDTLTPTVVLIHGLARTEHSMRILAMRLRRAGFHTRYIRYNSRRASMDEATATAARQILRLRLPKGTPLHLVGHSLGGVLAVRLKSERPDLGICRVVQLGAPNRGSGMARLLSETILGREVFGPVISELAADPGDAWLLDPDILAFAGATIPSLFSRQYGVHGPNDGLVSARSAWGRAAGHRVRTETIHGWMPLSGEVAVKVVQFLRTGEVSGERP